MDIINRNKLFIDEINSNNELRSLRDNLVKGQHPSIIVICCSDSRVVPEKILSASLGDLFVIRTAGNVINEGELASISYAIEHLHINHILLIGHTHCGAIHSVIHNEGFKYMDPIASRIKHNIGDITDELEATRINACIEVSYLKAKFPKYKGIIEKQYSNLDYEIINEIIDDNEAKVNVEIEVFNLDIASIRVNNDLEKDKSYFMDGNRDLDKDKYINYKLDIMENINERIKYQVEIGFEKQNKEWIMKELSTDTLRKIHGIYSSKL